jgi:Tol biopolymer transport system component
MLPHAACASIAAETTARRAEGQRVHDRPTAGWHPALRVFARPELGRAALLACLPLAAALLVGALLVASPAGAAFPGKNGRIAFDSDRVGGVKQIFTMKANGKGQRKLTSGAESREPAWSPNGKLIVFERAGDVFRMNAKGNKVRNLTKNPGSFDGEPVWSPNGKWIAFESTRDGDEEIFRMRANGTKLRQLTKNNAHDTDPAWSSNGKIAFGSDRTGNFEIFTMRANGKKQRQLTRNDAKDDEPDWSPNGKWIVFHSDRFGPEDDVFKMRANGKKQRRLTTDPSNDDRNAAFSPDGKWITFESERDGDKEIFKMRANGARQQQLTRNLADDGEPDWQPLKRRR